MRLSNFRTDVHYVQPAADSLNGRVAEEHCVLQGLPDSNLPHSSTTPHGCYRAISHSNLHRRLSAITSSYELHLPNKRYQVEPTNQIFILNTAPHIYNDDPTANFINYPPLRHTWFEHNGGVSNSEDCRAVGAQLTQTTLFSTPL